MLADTQHLSFQLASATCRAAHERPICGSTSSSQFEYREGRRPASSYSWENEQNLKPQPDGLELEEGVDGRVDARLAVEGARDPLGGSERGARPRVRVEEHAVGARNGAERLGEGGGRAARVRSTRLATRRSATSEGSRAEMASGVTLSTQGAASKRQDADERARLTLFAQRDLVDPRARHGREAGLSRY